MFGRALIVGCGLMGASLGLAIKSRSLAEEVIGWDSDQRATDAALGRGAIDRVASDPGAAAAESGLVVLAAYVQALPDLLRRVGPSAGSETVITDLGSVKGSIMAAARNITGPVFIGGHPMAGKASQGAVQGDPDLFVDAVWVLCPPDDPHSWGTKAVQRGLGRLTALVEALGSRPAVMPAEHHDRMVAAISHLPQAVVSALMNAAKRLDSKTPGALDLAASGFRDTTRIAASTPSMWRDISLDNREALLAALEQFEAELTAFKKVLTVGDAAGVEDFFTRSQAAKEAMTARDKAREGSRR